MSNNNSRYTMTKAAAARIAMKWKIAPLETPRRDGVVVIKEAMHDEGYSMRQFCDFINVVSTADILDEGQLGCLCRELADAYYWEQKSHYKLKDALSTLLFSVEDTVREIMSDDD